MSYPLRSFPGAALAGTLQTAITNSSTTFSSSTSLASWSDITGNNWTGEVCVAMEYGTANEEKILCTYNQSTGVFTVVNRNYDGTAKVNHAAGSLFVPVFTATEASELNQVTQSLATMLSKTGTGTNPGTIHIGSYSIGTSKFPALADHYHSLEVSDLNGWLTSTAAGTVPAAFYINTTNILSGTLPSGVLLPADQVSAGALPSGVTLPAAGLTGAGTLALSLLASGALPATVTTSRIWSGSGTGASPASLTVSGGYNNYLIIVAHIWTSGTTAGDNSATVTANSVTPSAANAYGRSTGTSGNHSAGISFTTGAACSVTTTASFPVSVTANQVTGTSNTHTLYVIGFN